MTVALMRTPMITLFHETVSLCFNSALEGMGSTVRDVIYDFLMKKGITRPEISSRFEDVIRILTETFGSSARIVIYKTVVELHKEYSMRTDFTYQDSLRDRIELLKDRVVADHLYPRRSQRTSPFLERPTPTPLVQAAGRSGGDASNSLPSNPIS